MQCLKYLVVFWSLIIISCSQNNYQQKIVNGVIKHQNKNTPNNADFELKFTKISQFALGDSINILNFDIDNNANMYVFDKSKGRVLKYDSSKKFVTQFGKYGSGPGEYSSRVGLMLVLKDRVIIQDGAQGKTVDFDKQGNFITKQKLAKVYTSLKPLSSQKYVAFFAGPKMTEKELLLELNLALLNEDLVPEETLSTHTEKIIFGEKKNPMDIISFYAVNKNTQKVALANNSDSKYQIDIFDDKGNKIEEIHKQYLKLDLSQREQQELSVVSGKIQKKGNNSISFAKMKFKKAIYHLMYDNKGRLWVFSSSNKQGEFVGIDIFENGKFLNRVELPFIKYNFGSSVLNLFNYLFIKEDKIYYFNKEENTIYTYKYEESNIK